MCCSVSRGHCKSIKFLLQEVPSTPTSSIPGARLPAGSVGKSTQASLGRQLTQSATQRCTVTGLSSFSHTSPVKKQSIFTLTVQHLEKYSSPARQLARRGWPWASRQEKSPPGGRGAGGRCWSCRGRRGLSCPATHADVSQVHICAFGSLHADGLNVRDWLYLSSGVMILLAGVS